MMNIIKKTGIILIAGACAFVIYMIFLLTLNYTYDYFDSKGMLEAKLFSSSFLKPIVLILISAWLILAGIFLSNKKTIKKGIYISYIYIAACVVPYPLSFFFTPSNSELTSTDTKNETLKVLVSETVQPAEGFNQKDMNPEFLSNYSDFLKETIIKGLKQELESKNKYLPKSFDMPSELMFVNRGEKKLAVVRFAIYGGASSVEILGINGDKIHRVSCNHKSSDKISLISGKCADRVSEIFNVDLVKGMEIEHL